MTSTLMEFFVRPALFWTCSHNTVNKLLEDAVNEENVLSSD